MPRRNETVHSAIFDDLLVKGLFNSRIKLNGAPFYVWQVRAMPPEKWVGAILRRHAEPIVTADSAEGCKEAMAEKRRARAKKGARV